MTDQEAHELRDEIARAIHIRRCCDSENDGWPFYRDHADAVLPIVTQREAALTAKIADYEHRISWETTCAGCAKQLDASYELYQLIGKINALADEWERSANERATEIYDDGRGFARYDGTWNALTKHAARLRGLVSGDNQCINDSEEGTHA